MASGGPSQGQRTLHQRGMRRLDGVRHGMPARAGRHQPRQIPRCGGRPAMSTQARTGVCAVIVDQRD